MQFGEQRTDKHFQNSKIHFGENRTDKHFKKQTNVVLGKIKHFKQKQNAVFRN